MSKFFDSLKQKKDLKFKSEQKSQTNGNSMAIAAVPANHHAMSTAISLKNLSLKKMPWILLVFLLPILCALFLFLVDPTARPLIQSDFAKTHKQKIFYYSEALKLRRDPETLVRRAWLYNEVSGSEKLEEEDLKAAADLGDKSSANIYERAMLRANDKGIDSKTISLLKDCLATAEAHKKSSPVDFGSGASMFSSVGSALLACGDFKTVNEMCNLPQYISLGQAEVDYLKAAMDRENGKEKSAQARLKNSETATRDYLSFDADLLRALIDLDRKDYAAAKKYTEASITTTAPDDDFTPYWTSNYIDAWIAYEQGQNTEAVKKADAVIENFTVTERPGITELSALAASYLLKAHALTNHGLKTEAVEAFQDFQGLKAKGISGKLVTPMPYRKWFEETSK